MYSKLKNLFINNSRISNKVATLEIEIQVQKKEINNLKNNNEEIRAELKEYRALICDIRPYSKICKK